MNRRQFLLTASALPVLQTLCPRVIYGASPARSAPYLALQAFIEPGHDEYAGEKLAAEIAEALVTALKTKRLPLSRSFVGSSVCPAGYRQIASDLTEAMFDSRDAGDGWNKWVASLGQIRRAQFFPLPDDFIRFEVAAERDGRLTYHSGLWKQVWADGFLTQQTPIEQHSASAAEPFFRDVTEAVFRGGSVYKDQLSRGIPYWRSRLDPATGIEPLWQQRNCCRGYRQRWRRRSLYLPAGRHS